MKWSKTLILKMEGWVTVYVDPSMLGVEMRKSILEAASIPCIILNRQDSSYSGIGFAAIDIDLLVPEDFADKAKQLIA